MSPLCVPQMMPNAAAGAVAMRRGLKGECYGTVSACAAGAQAIGAGMRMVERGDVAACVVGGTEAGGDAAFGRGVRRHGRDLRGRDLAAVRPSPRRLRDRRGRRDPRARGLGACGRARGAGPRPADRLRRDRRRLSPDRAGPRGRRRRAGDGGGASRRSDRAGRGGLRQRPRHLHAAERPLRDGGDQARLRRAGRLDPDLVAEIVDRAPARRRRRGRGRRDDAGALPVDRAADPEPRGARRGPRPRLRCPARPARSNATGERRSRSRTRSASAATTSSSASRRRHEPCGPRTTGPRGPGLAARAAGVALRPGQLPAAAKRSGLAARRRPRPRPGTACWPGPGWPAAGPCSVTRRTRRSWADRWARRTRRRSSG